MTEKGPRCQVITNHCWAGSHAGPTRSHVGPTLSLAGPTLHPPLNWRCKWVSHWLTYPACVARRLHDERAGGGVGVGRGVRRVHEVSDPLNFKELVEVILDSFVHCWASRHSLGCEDEDSGSSPGWWAATVAYLLPKQARVTPKILIFKTLRMTGRPTV